MTANEMLDRLEPVLERWEGCKQCTLCKPRKQVVHCDVVTYRPNPSASGPFDPLFVIGDAPNEADNKEGKPFAGKTGELLRDHVLKPSGVADMVLAGIVGCFPGPEAKPEFVHKKTCQPRLVELLEAVQPRAVLLVGRLAEEWWPRVQAAWGGTAEVVAIAHPSFILRSGWPNSPQAIDKVRVALGRVRRVVIKAGVARVVIDHEHDFLPAGTWTSAEGSVELRACQCGALEKPRLPKVIGVTL